MLNFCSEDITILGGGAAGISVGYYAKKSGLSFKVHEATDVIGGNATTLQYKDFFFDTGAHRWHDRHPEITTELKAIMGDDLQQIHVPSHIFYNSLLVDFPLSPLNLLKCIGPSLFVKAGGEVLINRIFNGRSIHSLEDFAIHTYGRSIADKFLLNYSEKLWGLPCDELSPQTAGRRMNGLDLKTFILEYFFSSKAKTKHLDGTFFYPKNGIGGIINRLIDACGKENIISGSQVTRIFHNGIEIQNIEINNKDLVHAGHVVNTLPLTIFLNMLTPPPPEDLLGIGNMLAYRHLKLVALFIDKHHITESATVYFPGKDFLFTRLYEPKKRSVHMSPDGVTSLVFEIPCRRGSEYWKMKDAELIEKTSSKLIEIGWIQEKDIMDACVYPMQYAYPILQKGFEEKVEKIFNYLSRFKNLALTGRNSRFEYLHMHDLMKAGKDIIEDYRKREER